MSKNSRSTRFRDFSTRFLGIFNFAFLPLQPGHTKFVSLSIIPTKKKKKTTKKTHKFNKCQIKLGFMETVLEIVLYIVQDIFYRNENFNDNFWLLIG